MAHRHRGSDPARLPGNIVRLGQGSPDLFQWIGKLEKLAERVCRIENPVGQAWGTGWLVAPDLVLTNWHVIAPALPNGDWHAKDFVCRFDYAVRNGATGEGQAVRLADDWQVAISPPSASEMRKGDSAPTPGTLDYALLRLQSRIGDEPGPSGSNRWKRAGTVCRRLPTLLASSLDDALDELTHSIPTRRSAYGFMRSFAATCRRACAIRWTDLLGNA